MFDIFAGIDVEIAVGGDDRGALAAVETNSDTASSNERINEPPL
jgi:hypothetical protein